MSEQLIISKFRPVISTLKDREMDATFQDEGNTKTAKHILNSLARISGSSGENIFKAIAGILSGPVSLGDNSGMNNLGNFLWTDKFPP